MLFIVSAILFFIMSDCGEFGYLPLDVLMSSTCAYLNCAVCVYVCVCVTRWSMH